MRTKLLLVCLFVLGTASQHARAQTSPRQERYDDPPGIPAQPLPNGPRASSITFGRFTSYQVNVDANGANIPGDAANEPSIAVNPLNHNQMAIGWRQFDTVVSNFRQAGWGYTTDGGATWTFPGKLDAGFFRSDPILDYDKEGNFYYCSLRDDFNSLLFKSTNGGQTWGPSVFAFGGDKQWIVIDRTEGMGHGNVYQSWSTAGNNYFPNTFNRSIDGGLTFQNPIIMDPQPVWGTLDVGPNGVLYVVGAADFASDFYVCRSFNAQNDGVTPTFEAFPFSMDGSLVFSSGPNPGGLLGQAWIAVNPSFGINAGHIYVVASVDPPGADPLDVHFVRSIDNGQTWSAPIKLNDDATSTYQWFATMSVAPDGRIDVVWNDGRNTGVTNQSELFYTYSLNSGVTWSPNEQVSPVWDSFLGWPNQQKIGDYYDMVSDVAGADLCWAATFNGEQDVYYLRLQLSTDVADGGAPGYRLIANDPNPFSASTTIRFDVPASGGRVKLAVFDVNGRRVRTLEDGFVAGGAQTSRWDGLDAAGRPAASGVYFCRLEASGATQSTKLMLVR
jgi:hypothetical protein